MVAFSRVASVAAVALLALPVVQAQGSAPRCQDLDATPYQNAASSTAPLLDLLERAAAPAGWSVRADGFGVWRGPMLRDDVPFRSAKDAVSRFIRDTADAGWPLGGTIDAPNCVIRVSYHGVVPKSESLTARTPSSTMVSASPSPSPPPSPLAPTSEARLSGYVLEGGRPLKPQLESWAKAAGWALVWDYPEDWIVPGGADFGADFQQAISRVGEALVTNGADLKTTIYLGNRTVRISSKR